MSGVGGGGLHVFNWDRVPNSDCKYIFPIHLRPKGISFDDIRIKRPPPLPSKSGQIVFWYQEIRNVMKYIPNLRNVRKQFPILYIIFVWQNLNVQLFSSDSRTQGPDPLRRRIFLSTAVLAAPSTGKPEKLWNIFNKLPRKELWRTICKHTFICIKRQRHFNCVTIKANVVFRFYRKKRLQNLALKSIIQ